MTRITVQAIRLQRCTRPLFVLLVAVIVGLPCPAAPVQAPATQPYVADFDRLLELIGHNDIYLADSGCDIGLLRTTLRPAALAATTGKQLLPVLERAVECLHDNHATFNTNIDSSTRLVPSDLQVWAQWQDGHAVVTQVRHASVALAAGIRRGDAIVAIDSVPIADAIEQRLPCCVHGDSALDHARQWALLALLAGRHDQAINLTVSRSGTMRQLSFDPRIAEAADTTACRM